ncbi:hypothetical protein IW261DRAFT_1558249 [Armillaria novae-zelandiae]|uniref:Uncharacterized protein n=1 Tax=Armillaria novae-zelandiae TaxID=153914 RepID=A0AA39PMS2_9AGAR|nr:hypothetical protein IW261DRAFT_1558249 [Armillaria novae-zelandiae]
MPWTPRTSPIIHSTSSKSIIGIRRILNPSFYLIFHISISSTYFTYSFITPRSRHSSKTFWSAVEAYELWLADKLKADKATQKKAHEQAKKLEELKLKKEREAMEKRAEVEKIAREAEEQRLAEEKKREEAVAAEAERKRLAEAKEEAARMRRLLKEQTELAMRQAAEAVESAAKAAEGDDEEATEDAGAEKEKAMEELKRRRKDKRKVKSIGAMGPSNKSKRLMRSVIESEEGEQTIGQSERPAKKQKGASAGHGELRRSDKCGRCRADRAQSKCMWADEAVLTAMEEVMALLHSLHARFDDMEEWLERMEEQLASVRGRINDLVDDFEDGDAEGVSECTELEMQQRR